MEYRFPGFTLGAPKGVEDHSILAFTLNPEGCLPFGVTMTRCPVPEGITLADYVAGDIAQRESSGEAYALAWKRSYSHDGLEGIVTAGTLEGTDERADERRLFILSGKTILVISALVQGAFTSGQLDALNVFIKGLHPDRTGKNA